MDGWRPDSAASAVKKNVFGGTLVYFVSLSLMYFLLMERQDRAIIKQTHIVVITFVWLQMYSVLVGWYVTKQVDEPVYINDNTKYVYQWNQLL